jgi:molybdate transport system permease protein
MESQAIWLTLRLAATTTLLLLTFAIPLAWWISNGRTPIRSIAQAITALPLVLPPTVIGFYLLVGLGPLTPVGRAIIQLLGHPLAFSFSGLVVGSVLYSVPFAIMPLVAGFQAIGPEYVEAASLLGASPLRSFFDITLPLARPALLSATVLVFLHTVGEFGVVLMLGGNIPGSTQTLSIALFDQVQDGNYTAANHTALLLIAFAIVGLILVYARRPWRQLA